MDLSEYLLKIDHFDKMHVLKDEGKIEGAPNFRQVPIFTSLIYIYIYIMNEGFG